MDSGGFADALTGGPVAGTLGQPLLLAAPSCLPAATAAEITALVPSTVTVLGGTASLGAGVAALATCVVTVAPPVVPVAPTGKITFGDGTHQVGASLPAGTYRTRKNVAGCYWARLSGFSGQLPDIIANNASDSHQVVTIGATDAGFQSTGCGTWTSDLSALRAAAGSPFGDGTWIVNTDIAAGTWSAPGGSDCYWQRSSDFSGTLSGITANDAEAVTPTVTIDGTDAGFTSENCGTWTQS